MDWGLLTPEQSWVVVSQLAPLARLTVWQRLLARLHDAPLPPPARLTVWQRLLARLHEAPLPPTR